MEEKLSNENLGIFGVLDGHGGQDVVNYCKTGLPDVSYLAHIT